MTTVLDLLKKAECGLTREQLLKKAQENEIQQPLVELKELVEKGSARIDEYPPPIRFKATNQVFQ